MALSPLSGLCHNSPMSLYMQKGVCTTQKEVEISEVILELLHSCHFLFLQIERERKREKRVREKGEREEKEGNT